MDLSDEVNIYIHKYICERKFITYCCNISIHFFDYCGHVSSYRRAISVCAHIQNLKFLLIYPLMFLFLVIFRKSISICMDMECFYAAIIVF